MSDLYAYGDRVTSIFQLIGNLENDITKSVAWALCKCPVFAKKVFDSLLDIDCDPDEIMVYYQRWEDKKGITDLEITDNKLFYAIIEAKRGWILPGKDQLTMYSLRHDICNSKAKNKAIISMSECSEEYAKSYLPFDEVNEIPVKHLSWRALCNMAIASRAESNNAQKNLLDELIEYFGGIMSMQAKNSNWVYVVSLSKTCVGGCELTYVDVVEKKSKYYHPYGTGGWPKEPPNYIAFRYNGQLQSIHHIESYVVTKNIHDEIDEMPDEEWETDHFVYTLGPAIRPAKVVKTGNIYRSGRKWAMLDLLLTSDTISEACELSNKRIEVSE